MISHFVSKNQPTAKEPFQEPIVRSYRLEVMKSNPLRSEPPDERASLWMTDIGARSKENIHVERLPYKN